VGMKKSVVLEAVAAKPGRSATKPTQLIEGPARTLTQEAYRRLEEMIVILELAPGEAVSEAILSRRLGIGTTPIREALLQLARENLVKIIPRSGVVVTAVDVRLQLEVLETRRDIDRLLARASAKRATSAERKNIAELARVTEQAVEKGDVREFLRQDAELNVWLGRSARNSVAMGIAGPLHSVSRRFWFYHLGEVGMFAMTADLHLGVVRAIAAADPEKAADASDRLIDHLVQFTTQTLPGP
jgi:DNA-binding GntR family transcriptional regulator